jgi:hypothetical protein
VFEVIALMKHYCGNTFCQGGWWQGTFAMLAISCDGVCLCFPDGLATNSPCYLLEPGPGGSILALPREHSRLSKLCLQELHEPWTRRRSYCRLVGIFFAPKEGKVPTVLPMRWLIIYPNSSILIPATEGLGNLA